MIVCLTLFYTYEGGITAVIWTDVIQMVLYIVGGASLSFCDPVREIPGGWAHVVAVAAPLGNFRSSISGSLRWRLLHPNL